MSDEPQYLSEIASSYAKLAAWMNRVAAFVFEIAERVLVVGAAKYAAVSLPASSPAKETVNTIAELLSAVLVFWLVTKLWAQSSADYITLHRGMIFKKRWSRIVYRVLSILIVIGFAYWMNQEIRQTIKTTVTAFASPEAH